MKNRLSSLFLVGNEKLGNQTEPKFKYEPFELI